MEGNIAISTLIYVMVLLFPGLLFRKFYYRGEFVKQLTQLNPVDKVIWNLFFSLMMILFTCFLLYLSDRFFSIKFVKNLNYNDLVVLSNNVKENRLPKEQLFKSTYQDILKLLTVLYFQSAALGYFAHWFVVKGNLDTKYSLLRFKNHWYYYVHGGKILYQKPKHNGKIDFTLADILCSKGDKTTLYSGIISQYTICQEKNVLENIFLSNPYRYKYNEVNGESEKVAIPSSIFCIPYSTILNINLIYVFKDKNIRIRTIIINLLTLLLIIALVTSIWFDLSYFGISTWWQKGIYCFLAFSIIANTRLLVVELLLHNSKKALIAASNNIYFGIWFLPLLNIISFFLAFCIFLAILIALGIVLKNSDTDE